MAAEDSILKTLDSASPKTLTSQFLSHLSPFSSFIPLHPKSNPISKKKLLPITPTSVRPLAKQFLPFLTKSLKLIPTLLKQQTPKIDSDRAEELLKIYRVVIDCMGCISGCLVGNKNFVDFEMVALVYCLESWGKYEEAEHEGVCLIGKLGVLEKREGLESEIAMLGVKVVVCVVGCAWKRKAMDGAVFKRNLEFVEAVLPLLRLLDIDSVGKYHVLLTTALCRSALFLAEECISFDSTLVREFCQKTLTECLLSSTTDRFQNVSRNICRSIDESWESRPHLILDILNITLKGSLCECKVGLVKTVNEFLESVSYCVKSLSSSSTAIYRGASELLYKYGGDFLQVSPPVASILNLYATGLYSKSCSELTDVSPILYILDDANKLQILIDSLGSLVKFYDLSSLNKVFSQAEAKESDSSFRVLESKNMASKHLHGNASVLSYLDALEYLCLQLAKYVNPKWKFFASQDNIKPIRDALLQFCDFIVAAFKCTKPSERDQERLHERRKTMLLISVSALKISLEDSESHKKIHSFFESIISSAWVEPQELKYFISALGNIGAALYNTRQLKQASLVLELRCKIIWAHVRLLCKMYMEKQNDNTSTGLSEDEVKTVIVDACETCAIIVDVLHTCCVSNVREIAVKCLIELSIGDDVFPNLSGSLVLVKQWVKMLCKDFKNLDEVEKAPCLYSLLLSRCSSLSERTLSKILEQELLTFGSMEARNPGFCKKMQSKVNDILLNNVLTTEEFKFQKSKVLVLKGRTLRAHGVEGLDDCIKCLRDAILLLKEISGKPSAKSAAIYNQLALTYLLTALCAQEANEDFKVVLKDVRDALEIWSNIDITGHFSDNELLELSAINTTQLLCNIVDLLSMKGCWELQFGVYKLIFMLLKCEKISLDKCLAMLWSERRLNHSLCFSPINEDSVLYMSEHLHDRVSSFEFWIHCLKDYPASLLAFFQKFLISDNLLTELNVYISDKKFGSIAINEVERVASSLISDMPSSSQSVSAAGYLYYDLAERLFSGGQLFEALSHARTALRLRKNMLQRKFFFGIKFTEPVQLADGNQNQQGTIQLEIIGSVATKLWPYTTKSGGMKDLIITPWSVLRCYLESILQVGIINESIGSGAEAKVLFLTGKRISYLQRLPIFQIVFTSLLGQLYRKEQLWDLAESELNDARDLLQENDAVISCKRCKLAFDVFIDTQLGDLSRKLSGKSDPLQLSSHALQVYEKALDKLNYDESESSLNFCGKFVGQLENLNAGKALRQARNLECTICSCTLTGSAQHVKQTRLENKEVKDLNLNKGIRKSFRISSKQLSKEKGFNADLLPNTCMSKKVSCNKNMSVNDGLDSPDACFPDNNICSGTLSFQNSKATKNSTTDFEGSEDNIFNNVKCWRCLLIQVMVEGNMKNIIYLKWEFHRRRLVLQLLLKIAKCKGSCSIKNKEHEVHNEYWKCISTMFIRDPNLCNNSIIIEACLVELIQGEGSTDIFPVERASLLYKMSWFFLKNCHSGNSSTKCCTLTNVQMCNVTSWLLRSFIHSRELPLLFQKVSKLLASILLISTIDGHVLKAFPAKSSLSTSHWAAYFHQASLGTYLPCQYLTSIKAKALSCNISEDPSAILLQKVIKATNFLRFAPERLQHLEDFVKEFFNSLPSVPVICISLLEGDFANLIGEAMLLPSSFPAWMLLSRLDGSVQPISMLLPIDYIQEEVELEPVKDWQCPWSYGVVDKVAPVFKQLLEQNHSSSNMVCASADTNMYNMNWWSRRTNLNKCINKFLNSMEDSWLGPWACLMLGERSDVDRLRKIILKLINELKIQCKVETNDSLISAMLSGSKSVSDVEACISQLILYKGFFGTGACCGEERLRAFSTVCPKETITIPESVHKLILEASGEFVQQADRDAVILVLDSDVQMLPWENLPTLRSQEVYRMPSVGSISFTLRRCSYNQKLNKPAAGFPLVNPSDTYYLLNPSGDLDKTQIEFEQWFRNQNWEGEAGKVPSAEDLVLALRNHDLFLYFGHGSGMQYIPGKELQKLHKCAATLLMGCSSGSLTYKGKYAPRGAPLSYLFAGSPAVIANLWDVTDKDIDRFGKAMLKSWLQEEPLPALEICTRCNKLVKEFGGLEIDDGLKIKRKGVRNKKLQEFSCRGKCKICGRKRIASFMSEARDACKLPFLIGASPVCYGVPTLLVNKSE